MRLEHYTNVPLTPAMTNKMVQITVEILDVLAIATKEMKQSQTSEFALWPTFLEANTGSEKFFKRVIGRTRLEDVLNKLDRLTNEEVAMACAQLVKVTNNIAGNQLRESLRKWQSPPDPSTNHHIFGGRQHKGTTEWFTDSDKYHKWKAAGSLLWVHGKRTFF
jgi:hypothetical protein